MSTCCFGLSSLNLAVHVRPWHDQSSSFGFQSACDHSGVEPCLGAISNASLSIATVDGAADGHLVDTALLSGATKLSHPCHRGHAPCF